MAFPRRQQHASTPTESADFSDTQLSNSAFGWSRGRQCWRRPDLCRDRVAAPVSQFHILVEDTVNAETSYVDSSVAAGGSYVYAARCSTLVGFYRRPGPRKGAWKDRNGKETFQSAAGESCNQPSTENILCSRFEERRNQLIRAAFWAIGRIQNR